MLFWMNNTEQRWDLIHLAFYLNYFLNRKLRKWVKPWKQDNFTFLIIDQMSTLTKYLISMWCCHIIAIIATLPSLQITDYGLTYWRKKQLRSTLENCSNRSCWDIVYLSPEILKGGYPSQEADIYRLVVFFFFSESQLKETWSLVAIHVAFEMFPLRKYYYLHQNTT